MIGYYILLFYFIVYFFSLFSNQNHIDPISVLTYNLLNFRNGIVHHLFLELPIIIFRDIKMRIWK